VKLREGQLGKPVAQRHRHGNHQRQQCGRQQGQYRLQPRRQDVRHHRCQSDQHQSHRQRKGCTRTASQQIAEGGQIEGQRSLRRQKVAPRNVTGQHPMQAIEQREHLFRGFGCHGLAGQCQQQRGGKGHANHPLRHGHRGQSAAPCDIRYSGHVKTQVS